MQEGAHIHASGSGGREQPSLHLRLRSGYGTYYRVDFAQVNRVPEVIVIVSITFITIIGIIIVDSTAFLTRKRRNGVSCLFTIAIVRLVTPA